jgi:hypothetical protein
MMLLPIVSKVCSTIAQELGSYCATLRWHAHIRGLTSAKVLASAASQGSAYSAPTHLPESEPIAVLAQPSGGRPAARPLKVSAIAAGILAINWLATKLRWLPEQLQLVLWVVSLPATCLLLKTFLLH